MPRPSRREAVRRLVAYLSAHVAEDQSRDAYASPALWLLENLDVLTPRKRRRKGG